MATRLLRDCTPDELLIACDYAEEHAVPGAERASLRYASAAQVRALRRRLPCTRERAPDTGRWVWVFDRAVLEAALRFLIGARSKSHWAKHR